MQGHLAARWSQLKVAPLKLSEATAALPVGTQGVEGPSQAMQHMELPCGARLCRLTLPTSVALAIQLRTGTPLARPGTAWCQLSGGQETGPRESFGRSFPFFPPCCHTHPSASWAGAALGASGLWGVADRDFPPTGTAAVAAAKTTTAPAGPGPAWTTWAQTCG